MTNRFGLIALAGIFMFDGGDLLLADDFAAIFAANRVWHFLARPYAAFT